jgi:hypothetical protein
MAHVNGPVSLCMYEAPEYICIDFEPTSLCFGFQQMVKQQLFLAVFMLVINFT